MKKAIVTLMFLFMMGSMMAQIRHMTFKDIPIDGTLNEFTAKLVNQGFRYADGYARIYL